MTASRRRYSVATLYTIYESMFYCATFAMFGLFTTYLTAYSFSNQFIALTLSVVGITSMVLSPVIAAFTDKTDNCRLVNQISLIATEAAVMYFFSLPEKTEASAMIFAIFGYGGIRTLMSETDTWVSKLISRGEKINYGSTRAAGSISYAVSAFAVGRLLAYMGYDFARWVFTVLLSACFIITFFIPNPHKSAEEARTEKVTFSDAFRVFSKNKVYMMFLLCNMIYMCTNAVCENYIGPLVLDLGGTSAEVGMMSGILACLEFIFMPQFSRFADALGTRTVIVIGLFGFGIKALSFSLARSIPALLLCSVTQIISFAIMTPARIRLVSEEIPPRYIASGLIMVNLAGQL
ncbi:MAG: MFS transporter, partial [Oscillospiraceae bacterium]